MEGYDKLLLAPGAAPTRPPLPGLDSPRLFSLRTVGGHRLPDSVVCGAEPALKPRCWPAGASSAWRAWAENLAEMGVEVTILQRIPQLMNPLDYDMATFLHSHLRRKGMHLRLNTAVAGLPAGGGDHLCLGGGGRGHSPRDLAILAIGVTPENALAKQAGLALGSRGGIVVNQRMETPARPCDIYAVGDAVEIPHLVTGENTLISLAGPANKQGRVAADNICGGDSRSLRRPGVLRCESV